MKKQTAAVRKATDAGKRVAAKPSGFPRVICFDYLNETPGAHRYQEVHSDGKTPLVSDADGAQIGGLYLRKAQFPVAPKRIVVTIGE